MFLERIKSGVSMSIVFDKNKGKLFQNQFPLKQERLEDELMLSGTYIDMSQGEPCMMNIFEKTESEGEPE